MKSSNNPSGAGQPKLCFQIMNAHLFNFQTSEIKEFQLIIFLN